ncbi:hypothetical protein [Frankia sp. Cas4]|uniref:hypothetical protein n=1 Tax=Frankia sp. Cas4 TaxID=3073927 RepID=UPI002AD44D22|nr:hypothetical protein [Frankia sp. Cas4]
MRELLADSLTETWRPSLPSRAQSIVEAGWMVGPNGALLLRAMYGDSWSGEFDPLEIGHYEYEVNDVYISLSDLRGDMGRYLPRAASRGLFFARRMLRDASALEGCDRLLALVSIFADEDYEGFFLQGATVKFFSRRGHYPDWFEDLEGFQREAIAILDLADVAGF